MNNKTKLFIYDNLFFFNKWDNKIFNLLKKKSNYFYDGGRDQWDLPINDLEIILSFMEQNGYNPVIEYVKPRVYIYKIENEFRVNFDYHPEIVDLINVMPDSRWDDKNNEWFLPEYSIENFLEMLRKKDIIYYII